MAISGIFSVLWTFLSFIWHLLLTIRLLTALRLCLSMTPGPRGDWASPSSNDSVLSYFSRYETDLQCSGTYGNPHISFLVFGKAFLSNSPGHIVLAVMLQQVENNWSLVFHQLWETLNNVICTYFFSLFYIYTEISQCSRTHFLNFLRTAYFPTWDL